MAGSKLQRRAGPLARVRLNDLFRLQRIRAVIGCRHASAVSCARRDLAGYLMEVMGVSGRGGCQSLGGERWGKGRGRR